MEEEEKGSERNIVSLLQTLTLNDLTSASSFGTEPLTKAALVLVLAFLSVHCSAALLYSVNSFLDRLYLCYHTQSLSMSCH